MLQGWDAEAGNWATFARTPGFDPSHERINLPALLEIIPLPGRATLDLACGEGRLTRKLAGLGHRVAGIDAAPAMAELAAAQSGAPPVVQGDAARLPFRDDAFDLVLAYMCLHDIDAMPAAAAEIGRVLEPGGRLCLAIPHPLNTAGRFAGREPDAPFVIAGSYLDARRTAATAERDGVRLTFHSEHRPLEAYARALEAAGLLTETIREVPAPEQVAQADPPSRRWQRIPLFLHLRAVRPARRGDRGEGR
ncbi:MAG TPA: class I SAM-dependent methyltransferase [Streptosporangiaceae bacterium]|jgi:SAM-dependent methyltransferase